MELLDVTLTELQRRSRSAFVAWTPLLELRPGEKVVLRDDEGEYFAGTVVGLFEDGDPRYQIHVGVRLPEEYAVRRLERDLPEEDLDVCGPAMVEDMQSLLDMLGDARQAVARRAARESVRREVGREGGAQTIVQMPPQRPS